MGGKDPNRQPPLTSLRGTLPGWIRLATCNACGHRGPLPVERMIRKHGELALMEFVMAGLRCLECDQYRATSTMLQLCDPGCGRQRE